MSPLFVVASALAVAGALGVVAARTPVHGVLAMLVNFAGLAVLLLTLQAEFLAVTQIIIYAGAVLVLFLFVINLLTARLDPIEAPQDRLRFQAPLAVAAVAGLGIVLLAGLSAAPEQRPPAAELPPGFGGVAAFGRSLLTRHPFELELVGLVLLVAMVGVMVLVGRRPQATADREAHTGSSALRRADEPQQPLSRDAASAQAPAAMGRR